MDANEKKVAAPIEDDCSDLINVSHSDSENGLCIVKVSGELSIATKEVLREHTAKLIVDGKVQILFDFSDVTFIDSTGLAVVLSTLRRVRERGGYLRIVASRRNLLSLFQLTGVDGLLEIYPTVEEAIKRININRQ